MTSELSKRQKELILKAKKKFSKTDTNKIYESNSLFHVKERSTRTV